MRRLWEKRVSVNSRKRIFSKCWGGWEKDSFCGCSIPTVFNQRWIFLKRDQMKQVKKETLALGVSASTFGGRQFRTPPNASAPESRLSSSFVLSWCCERVFQNKKKSKATKVDLRKKIKCAYVSSHDHRSSASCWEGRLEVENRRSKFSGVRYMLERKPYFWKGFSSDIYTQLLLEGREYVMKFLMNFKTCPKSSYVRWWRQQPRFVECQCGI